MESFLRFWTNHQIRQYGVINLWIRYKINVKISWLLRKIIGNIIKIYLTIRWLVRIKWNKLLILVESLHKQKQLKYWEIKNSKRRTEPDDSIKTMSENSITCLNIIF